MKWYLVPVNLVEEYLLIISNQIKYWVIPNPPIRWQVGNKVDVVLIPGVHESWIFLQKIAGTLNKFGYRVHVIKDLKTNTEPVMQGCKRISKYINEHNLKQVILITHSKGGINGLYLLKDKYVSKKVIKLITIACPFRGSILAGLMPSSMELIPSSSLIKNAFLEVDHKKIFNLYPRIDNHVVPNKYLIPDKVHSKKIDIAGHTRILESKEAIKEILCQLKIDN
jgi:triacylglycerol lipase